MLMMSSGKNRSIRVLKTDSSLLVVAVLAVDLVAVISTVTVTKMIMNLSMAR